MIGDTIANLCSGGRVIRLIASGLRTFRGSSAVERSALARVGAGSNPAPGLSLDPIVWSIRDHSGAERAADCWVAARSSSSIVIPGGENGTEWNGIKFS